MKTISCLNGVSHTGGELVRVVVQERVQQWTGGKTTLVALPIEQLERVSSDNRTIDNVYRHMAGTGTVVRWESARSVINEDWSETISYERCEVKLD